MDLRHLRYFVAVAEAGSFSAAARRCRIAQPSLSQQIQKLESEIGRPLFDRLGRTIALTEAGALLLPRARRILDELREAQDRLSLASECGEGSLAVGALPTLAPYLLPAAIQAFSAAWPHAKLTVQEDLTERLVEGLMAAELDVALVSTPIEHEAIEVAVLARDNFVVALPPGHPLASREIVDLADLAEEPAVALDEIHCLGQQVDEICRVMKVNLRVTCRTMQMATLLQLVSLGVGVALVPEMTVQQEVGCVLRPLRGAAPYREVAVATRRGRTRCFLAERFIEVVAAPAVPR